MTKIRKIFFAVTSSFFYIGYLPLIPGTFASAAGVLLFYLIRYNTVIYILSTLLLIIFGLWVSGRQEEIVNRKDPSSIVIDEVCGMLLSLMFIAPDFKLVVFAFFIFRILDTLKPYPAGTLQRLKGGIGIMGDDIISGIYTNIILQLVLRLTSSSRS